MSKAPFLPIRDLVIFPNVVTPIYVGRANSIATLEKAIANKTKLVLGLQKDASQENPTVDGDIYEVGVIANIDVYKRQVIYQVEKKQIMEFQKKV